MEEINMDFIMRPPPLSDPDIAKMRFMMCEITNSDVYKLSGYEDECLIVLRENLELYMKSVLAFMAKEKKMYVIDCPTLTHKCENHQKGKPPESENLMPWQATINWGSLAEDEIATMKNNTKLEREAAKNKRKRQSERNNGHKCKRRFNTSKCRETDAENEDEGDKDKNENNEGDSKKETLSYYIKDLIVPKLMYKGPTDGTTAIFTLKDLQKLLEWNCHVIPRKSVHDIFMKRIAMKMNPRTVDTKI